MGRSGDVAQTFGRGFHLHVELLHPGFSLDIGENPPHVKNRQLPSPQGQIGTFCFLLI